MIPVKIGEFAAQFNVTRDTVRFYITNGLLIPDDQGAQYNFTQRECQDMETILRMKEQQFSLKEIREYLSILRVSTMVEPESIQGVVDLLDHKKAELDRQADQLRAISESIDGDIQTLLTQDSPQRKRSGVPLRALSLLACPYCGKALELKRASLSSRHVYSGILHCDCGYQISSRTVSSKREICIPPPMTSRTSNAGCTGMSAMNLSFFSNVVMTLPSER